MYQHNSDSFQIYISTISNITQIPASEQKRLAVLAQNGDNAARNKLVECNLKFVVKTAIELSKKHRVPIEDLVQAGNIGLLRAIKKFDANSKFNFLTYARNWIFCEMSDELEFHYNKNAFIKGFKFASCEEDDFDELPATENVEDYTVKKLMAEKAVGLLNGFSKTSREVIQDRFGLFGKEEKSLEKIGQRLGHTREWIRQVEAHTIRELRTQMAA